MTSNFGFGGPVAFTGQPDSLDVVARRQLEEQLAAARARIAALGGELFTAKAARATAEKARADAERREAVARNCLSGSQQLLRNNNDAAAATQMADAYDQALRFQEENEHLKRTIKDHRSELSELQTQARGKDSQIQNLETQLASKKNQVASLYGQLEDTRKKLNEQKEATDNVDTLLTKAYADLNTSEDERKAAVKAKDDFEAQLKDTELQLQDLNQQWQDAQNQLAELQSQVAAAEDVERNNAGLNEDIENLREQLETRQRTLIVKDERITHLEDQYQKALQGRLTAEAAINAATAPTDAPPIIYDNSLGNELAAVDDSFGFVDDDSTYEHLELSDITETANVPPKEPTATPTLTVNVTQAASLAPTEHNITTSSSQTYAPTLATVSTQTNAYEHATSSTQTEQPQVERAAAQTQTDSPKLSASIIHTATVETPPIEPTKVVATISTQTDTPVPAERTVKTPRTQDVSKGPIITVHDQQPIAEETLFEAKELETPLPIATPKGPQKYISSINPLLAIAAAIFAFLCLHLYARVYVWETTNGYRQAYYYGNPDRRYGAFGRGRYLFGIFPVGFDIGSGYWSEQMCRQTSRAIGAVEDWLGVTPTPLY